MKRSNGEGSIYYDPIRGRYVYRTFVTDPTTGKTTRKAFTSVKSAREAKNKAKAYVASISEPPKQKLYTLIEWLKEWLDEYRKNSVKIKTYERYQNSIERNIGLYDIGNVAISELTSMALQKHFNFLLESGGENSTGIAPRSINSTRKLLISALNDATELGLISKNPASKTKPMKVTRANIRVLTKEEADRIRDAAYKYHKPSWIAICIALGTGMRLGEIFGLEWSNIDTVNKTARIDNIIISTNHGARVQNSTKTKSSRRTVSLPDFVCAAILKFKLWQVDNDQKFGTNYHKSKWLLANPEGNYSDPNHFSSHKFKQILTDANIEGNVRFHDLRHTHATWLLSKGVNVKVVSERLGHSNIRITLDTYSHVLESMQQEAIDTLNKIF